MSEGHEETVMSLAAEQTLALAMARHARLGTSSPAAVLDEDTLHSIFLHVQRAHGHKKI